MRASAKRFSVLSLLMLDPPRGQVDRAGDALVDVALCPSLEVDAALVILGQGQSVFDVVRVDVLAGALGVLNDVAG
jgi:hypothetical protein